MSNEKAGKPAQSNSERQAAFKARKAAAGMTEVRGIFASPEHTALIKLYAGQLKTAASNQI